MIAPKTIEARLESKTTQEKEKEKRKITDKSLLHKIIWNKIEGSCVNILHESQNSTYNTSMWNIHF